MEAVSKEKKLLYLSLYFLIWGEASNVRFLPECLCYIFHHVRGLGVDSFIFAASSLLLFCLYSLILVLVNTCHS